MAGGFSFCGVDIASIGLDYAPELEDTYVYRAAKPRIHEETFDGHDGGYYYGVSKEPKEFILRCYFEETEIDRGVMARIENLFKAGRSGKLIFDRRPWCYYYATVTDLDTSEITNYLNGVVKITMKAYYPFAKSDIFYITRQYKDYYRAFTNTAFPVEEAMVPSLTLETPITQRTEFLLLNPGTERADLGIEIAGSVGKGVVIKNLTTEQECRFVAMSEDKFDGINSFIYVDGISGKTVGVKDGKASTAFLYHDQGFIQLAPAYPAKRDVRYATKNGTIYVLNRLFDRLKGETVEEANELYRGQFVYIDKWYEIESIGDNETETKKKRRTDEHRILTTEEVPENKSGTTMICQLNKLVIEPVDTMKITRLNFIYKPTFS